MGAGRPDLGVEDVTVEAAQAGCLGMSTWYLNRGADGAMLPNRALQCAARPSRNSMTDVANKNVVVNFINNLSAGKLDVALALMADTATWWVAGNPEQFALAGTRTKAEFLEMLEVIGAVMPDGVQVSICCSLRRGGPEVAVTATWDFPLLASRKGPSSTMGAPT